MERFSRGALAACSLGCVFLDTVFLPAGSIIAVFVVLMAVFGFGFGISQPLSMVMVSDRAVSGFTGLAMGIRFMIVMAASLAGPLIFGFVADAFGLPAAFYVAAGLLVPVAV